jgi:hypothetical protein
MEKDLNFVAEKTNNTNVGFVSLLRRCEKPWRNGRVKSVNFQLDWAQMGHDISHINVNDTSTTVREGYTTHGLRLNSRGKMKAYTSRCGKYTW